MPRLAIPPHLLVAAATLLTLCLLASLTSSQSGKSPLPDCPSNESVCNAILHFPDRIVDQGRYCNGCSNCVMPAAASESDLKPMDDSSFYWQHWEDPNMRVQFVKCSPMPKRGRCSPDDEKPAAVFVSPMSVWSPHLRHLRCNCPDGQFQLRSWRPEDGGKFWLYEFACRLRVCPMTTADDHDGDRGEDDDVCVVKRRANENSPASVEFRCTCPPEYHCVIKEVQTKKPASEHQGHTGSGVGGGGSGGGGSGTSGAQGGGSESEWQAGGGGQISRRRCQKTHHQSGANSTTR